jgi:ataxia telangiectasia mutated family protein
MTADMVDGMGTTGTQGVFQRCAEETLRVLRGDSEVILTVLEVFKYDPLHSWCVFSPPRTHTLPLRAC